MSHEDFQKNVLLWENKVKIMTSHMAHAFPEVGSLIQSTH